MLFLRPCCVSTKGAGRRRECGSQQPLERGNGFHTPLALAMSEPVGEKHEAGGPGGGLALSFGKPRAPEVGRIRMLFPVGADPGACVRVEVHEVRTDGPLGRRPGPGAECRPFGRQGQRGGGRIVTL